MAPKRKSPERTVPKGTAKVVTPGKVAKRTDGYHGQTVPNLKAELKRRGALVGGIKDDLIDWLEDLDGKGLTAPGSAAVQTKAAAKKANATKKGSGPAAKNSTGGVRKKSKTKVTEEEEDEESDTEDPPAKAAPTKKAPVTPRKTTGTKSAPGEAPKTDGKGVAIPPRKKSGQPKPAPINGHRTGSRSSRSPTPSAADDALTQTKTGKVAKATAAEQKRATKYRDALTAMIQKIRDEQGGIVGVRRSVFARVYELLMAAMNGLAEIEGAETVETAVAEEKGEAELPAAFEEEDEEEEGAESSPEKDVDDAYEEDVSDA
ncbi:hypothetical protein LTR85_011231 [Meristemomyces frigidus]|nr:hypothetical protein LTR85_011231 [Meristemomyces frigidus]